MKRYFRNIRMIFLIFVSITILMSFSGCNSNRDREVNVPKEEKEFIIFYDDSCNVIWHNFKLNYPDIEAKWISIDISEESIEDAEFEHGSPDLILMGAASMSWLLEDQGSSVEALGEYIYEDENLGQDEYFPGTFEIGYINDQLLAIPLEIYMDMLIVREDDLKGSALEKLEYGYTGKELFAALEEEAKKGREEDSFLISDSGRYPVDWIYRMNGIIEEMDGTVTIDEELVQAVYSFEVQNREIRTTAREYYQTEAENGFIYSGKGAETYHGISALDPRIFEGKFYASLWTGAPQIGVAIAKSTNLEIHNQNIEVFYVPNADSGDQYTASVSVLGMIGKNSDEKENAYEVLKKMMDMPNQLWAQPNSSGFGNIGFSVNKESAINMLEVYNEDVGLKQILNPSGTELYAYDKCQLSEKEKDKITDVLGKISGMYVYNDFVDSGAVIFEDYLNAGIKDYQYFYYEIMQLMNPNSQEWSEIENYKELESSDEEETNSDLITDEPELSETAIALKEEIRTCEEGNTLLFGAFEQDNNLENGSEMIEWVVLEKNEDTLLLISKKSLMIDQYKVFDNEEDRQQNTRKISFVKSDVYEWLNLEFYESAFDADEKQLIVDSEISVDLLGAREEGYFGTNLPVEATEGTVEEGSAIVKLFILNEEETMKYFPNDEDRRTSLTPYAASMLHRDFGENLEFQWWLRTRPNVLTQERVETDGTINQNAKTVMYEFAGVRPVMCVDISER